jgi:hypothetical protein
VAGNLSLTSIDTKITTQATGAKQDTTNSKLDTVITNTTNLSTSALQTAGNNVLGQINTAISKNTYTGNDLNTNIKNLPADPSTGALQTAGNNSLTNIDTKQTAGNASLTNIDADIGARNDTPATDDTGVWSLIQLFKRNLQNFTTLLVRIPTLGQKVATGSSPVVIATDQTAVKVQNEIYEASGILSANLDIIPSFDASKYSELLVQIVGSAYSATLTVFGSNDNLSWTAVPITNVGYTGNPTMNNPPLQAIFSGIGGYKAPVNYRYMKVTVSSYVSGTNKVMLLAKTQPSSNATMGVSTIHKTYGTQSNTIIALANTAQTISTNTNRAGFMIQNTDSNPSVNWVRVCWSNSYTASASTGFMLNSNQVLQLPPNLSTVTNISIFSPVAGTSVAFCEFSY